MMTDHMASLREILLLPPEEVWDAMVSLFGRWPDEEERTVGVSYALEHLKKSPPPMRDFTLVDEGHPCWHIASHFLPLDDELVVAMIKAIRRYNQSTTQPLETSYLFDITGDKEMRWLVDGWQAHALISPEDEAEATCTITIAYDDLLGMLHGTLNPPMLFMMGKMKIVGDMGAALKLSQLFSLSSG